MDGSMDQQNIPKDDYLDQNLTPGSFLKNILNPRCRLSKDCILADIPEYIKPAEYRLSHNGRLSQIADYL